MVLSANPICDVFKIAAARASIDGPWDVNLVTLRPDVQSVRCDQMDSQHLEQVRDRGREYEEERHCFDCRTEIHWRPGPADGSVEHHETAKRNRYHNARNNRPHRVEPEEVLPPKVLAIFFRRLPPPKCEWSRQGLVDLPSAVQRKMRLVVRHRSIICNRGRIIKKRAYFHLIG